jgi:hypothetical protein
VSDERSLQEKSQKCAPPPRTPWAILFRIGVLVALNFGGLAIMAEYRLMEILLAPGGAEKMPSVGVALLFLIGRAGMYFFVPGLVLVGIYHLVWPWETRKRMRKRLLEERRSRALREQGGDGVLLHDPIEDDPAFREVIARAKELGKLELKGREEGEYFSSFQAKTQKRILVKEFGITWFSTGDLNHGKYD